jgi:hypothetical protein
LTTAGTGLLLLVGRLHILLAVLDAEASADRGKGQGRVGAGSDA